MPDPPDDAPAVPDEPREDDARSDPSPPAEPPRAGATIDERLEEVRAAREALDIQINEQRTAIDAAIEKLQTGREKPGLGPLPWMNTFALSIARQSTAQQTFNVLKDINALIDTANKSARIAADERRIRDERAEKREIALVKMTRTLWVFTVLIFAASLAALGVATYVAVHPSSPSTIRAAKVIVVMPTAKGASNVVTPAAKGASTASEAPAFQWAAGP